jgi:hypothetical protein
MDSSVDIFIGLGLPAIIPLSASSSPDGVFTYSFRWLTFLASSLTDWLDQTSNITISSYELYTLALPPTHIIVGLLQMDGVAQRQFMM